MASASTSGADAATSYYTSLSFTEVLEDLSIRFVVNLPQEELSSIERIGFQVEQAHWFYEDFVRPLNPSLPSYPLRRFSSLLLRTASQTVPLIEQFITGSASKGTDELESAFDEFLKYKTRVPVCGAAIVNRTWDKVLLVKGWKSSASWGFPKGKINQSESPVNCAIREVWEETGFDCTGLVSEAPKDSLEVNMREQRVRLFFVKGVDEETVFEAKARKEISKIAWFPLNELPTWKTSKSANGGGGNHEARKFYLVSPFVGKLKSWVKEEKERERRAGKGAAASAVASGSAAIPTAPAAMREAQKSGFEGVPSGPSADRRKAAQDQQAAPGVPTFPDTSTLWQLLGGESSSASAPAAAAAAAPAKASHASCAPAAGSTSNTAPAAARDQSQALLQTLMGGGANGDAGSGAAPPATSQAASNLPDVLSRSVGASYIREQGDERGRELLSLIQPGSAIPGGRGESKEDRLLGLLNGDAAAALRQGHQQQPAKEDVLLGFSEGSTSQGHQVQPHQADQASQLLSILGGHAPPSHFVPPAASATHRTDSPLPAPRAKQAADLRGMLNLAGTPDLNGAQSSASRRDGQGPSQPAPAPPTEEDEEERRKQRQREMVLRNMLALSGSESSSSSSQQAASPQQHHFSPPQQHHHHQPPPLPPTGPSSLLDVLNGGPSSFPSTSPQARPSFAQGGHLQQPPRSGPAALLSLINGPGSVPPPPAQTHEEKLLSLLGSQHAQHATWPGSAPQQLPPQLSQAPPSQPFSGFASGHGAGGGFGAGPAWGSAPAGQGQDAAALEGLLRGMALR